MTDKTEPAQDCEIEHWRNECENYASVTIQAEDLLSIISRGDAERAARIKAEAKLKELREALNKIATMRKIGATPKFIKGEIIEEIERIALGALITPSEGR